VSGTNIDPADDLVEEDLSLTHFKTKNELLNYALKELVRRERRKGILDLEEKIDLKEMRKIRV
jgi:hypothetical protein